MREVGDDIVKILCSQVSDVNIVDIVFCNTEYRASIFASISSKDISKSMVRVRSSNIWSYGYNAKSNKSPTGDVYVQFKGKNGGPDDIYVYYDVPMMVYRRWHSAPSKGHYFWRYIRNTYTYAKLTGDRRTKLSNGVNSR